MIKHLVASMTTLIMEMFHMKKMTIIMTIVASMEKILVTQSVIVISMTMMNVPTNAIINIFQTKLLKMSFTLKKYPPAAQAMVILS